MKKLFTLFLSSFVFFNLASQEPFIIKVKTDTLVPFGMPDNYFYIPTDGASTYDYNVDWDNDGVIDTSNVDGPLDIFYASAGTYEIAIYENAPGSYPNPIFGDDFFNAVKIIDIVQWGDIKWQSMVFAFSSCFNMQITAIDTPDLSEVTDMFSMFDGTSFSTAPSVSNFDVSKVKYFDNMFSFSDFNGPVNGWKLDSAISLSAMFSGTFEFNQPLNNWNLQNVEDVSFMFADALVFNQDISGWNVSNILFFDGIFQNAPVFNQDISNWDVSSAESMTAAFMDATSFNQDLSNWDVSAVAFMDFMFNNATSFDQSLASWDISNVTNMNAMLDGANLSVSNYDQTLESWATQTLQSNVQLGADGLVYCNGKDARDTLIQKFNWTIQNDIEDCSLLPVELINFKAEQSGGFASIQWNVANALNFSHFVLEKKLNNGDFEEIARIPFHENTYQYTFRDPLKGQLNYYRLKMVDIDGSFEYSKVIYIQMDYESENFMVYPNPSRGNFTIEGRLLDMPFTIYGSKGQVVNSGRLRDTKQRFQLPSGVYYLKVGTHPIQRIVVLQ